MSRMRMIVAVGTAIGLGGCSLLFVESEGATQPEELEFMTLLEGDPEVAGEELYVARTVDGTSFIERYSTDATPQALPGRIELAIRPTAIVGGRGSSASLVFTGDGDSDGDGEFETQFIDRIEWANEAGGFESAVSSSSFPHRLGPRQPVRATHILADAAIPDVTYFVSSEHSVALLNQFFGWDRLEIEPEPWLPIDDEMRCLSGHDVGGNRSEIAAFSSRNVQVVDANDMADGQTLRDVPVELYPLSFRVEDCAHINGPSYLTTDGAALYSVIFGEEMSTGGPLPLPGVAGPHERVVGLRRAHLNDNGDPDMVLVVADPPTIYLGLDLSVSDGLSFSQGLVVQPLDWIPTAVVRQGSDGGPERIFVGEQGAAPRCLELGSAPSGLAPALLPCAS